LKASKKPAIAAESDRAVEIYTKAAEIFHEQGFDATSMSMIAAAVDLTKAGLYYYIESKEDLLFAIMDYAMGRLESEVIEPSRLVADAGDRLRSIISRHCRLLTEGNKAITILTDEVEGLKPKHRKQILDRKRVYFDFVRGTLDELKRSGRLRDINTTVATFGLFGTLLWLPRWFRVDGQLTGDQVAQSITGCATMNIIVCIKQILDPEIPARDFRVDSAKRQADRGSANLVMNIFCENALETALQTRDACGGKITALAVGPPDAEDVLRKALALKADEAILVASDAENPDPLFVARALAAAIRKLGQFDVIAVGREAGDWGAGQTGGLVAEELGLPCISFVESIEAGSAEGRVQVKRQTDTGYELLDAATPLVVTITNHDKNVPRIPKTRDVMQSYRKPLAKWSLGELDVDVATANAYYEVADLFVPEKETRCEFIEGDTIEEKVDAFAQRISEVLRAM
jgi:electron transfer flavoprotein beta subunit